MSTRPEMIRGPSSRDEPGSWTFLTNHAHVLLALHRDPDLRQRDIAALVGITEGAVQRILNELESGGYLSIERIGRRNHYDVNTAAGLRHPLDAGHTVGELLDRLGPHRSPQRNLSSV
jgi:DNA-binding transcriptional regulator LsrR (DeoR family)